MTINELLALGRDDSTVYAIRLCHTVTGLSVPLTDSEVRTCSLCSVEVWYNPHQSPPPHPQGKEFDGEIVLCLECGVVLMAAEALEEGGQMDTEFPHPSHSLEDSVISMCATLVTTNLATWEEVREQVNHVSGLWSQFGGIGPMVTDEEEERIDRFLDLVLLGVLYHRYVPEQGEDGKLHRRTAETPLPLTLAFVCATLESDQGVPKEHILTCLAGAERAAGGLFKESPEEETPVPEMLMFSALGMLVHVLMPRTNEVPDLFIDPDA